MPLRKAPLTARSAPHRIPPDARSTLLASASYREFLKTYTKVTGLSFAEIARRAGFASRSYPRDVAQGRRRLTSKSLPSLLQGLRLDRNLALFYRALFYLAHPEEHPDRAPVALLQEIVDRSKTRAERPTTRRRFPSLAPFKEAAQKEGAEDIFEVLAALGKPDRGVTLNELSAQTGKSPIALARLLEELQAAELVVARDAIDPTQERRFLPAAGHMNFSWLPNHGGAQSLFLAILRRNLAAATNHFNRQDALFSCTALSVSRARLPALKEELREVILRFVDRTIEEETSPDAVAYLVTSMFESRLP